MKTREIDPLAAITLYNEGRSWAEIGRILALRTGRPTPFWSRSVVRAVRAHDRAAIGGMTGPTNSG